MLKKKVAFIILAAVTISCFAQAAEGWYNGKSIVNIQFKGLHTVNSAELDEVFKQYKGKPFSDDLYWEILQKIYALDYFNNIESKALPADNEYSSVYLEFVVTEKPAVKNIVFVGINQVGKSDLLSAASLKKGDIYNEAAMQNDTRAIKAKYVEKGFTKAEVSAKAVEDKENNAVTIEYTVTEGKMSVITAIKFEGNSKFPEKAIKKVLVSKEAGFLQKGAFQEAALQDDKNAIKMFYGEKGYIDAHVESIKKDVDSESDPLKEKITLTYVIMEGDQFKYTGVNFSGNYLFSSEELTKRLNMKTGEVFNSVKFERGFLSVIELYFENGYTSNYIDKKEERNEAAKEIGYTITIVERERSHVEKIIIKGNKKTKDYVILREMLLKEGDVFSKTKFVNSFRNLYNLRYFSSVVPDVQQGSEQDLVDVVVNVEEQNTATVNFGISFSGVSDASTFPMSVFTQWEERNLMGTGRELSAGLNASPDTQSLTLGFTENWFLGTPLSVGFTFSATHKKLYTYSDSKYPIGIIDSGNPLSNDVSLADAYKMKYDRLEFDFGINSGYRWFPKFATVTLKGGINFGIVKNFYNNKLYRPFEIAVRSQQAKWSLNNALWTQVSLDDRDVAHDPSRGWFLSQRFTFVGVLPKVEDEYYFKSDTKAEVYFTLLDYPVSDIWNLKFVLGFYSGFSFQVPTTKRAISWENRLNIDGMFIGRGWLGLGYEERGNVMQNNWIEFRWPLAHGILSFDFFFDAVAVKKDIRDLKSLHINDYYFSFGPGLRFSIQQFPLRLMFANTFKSINGKPVWGNGKKADWRFVISFNIPNI
ncbi:outer membrane protein assembly factor BamA [Treponema pedis]|uniref:outer membrane protein assembly factor BamA n=2 Tax=Treponema pedis TaxID=409322 RepID=UPI000402AB7C|nr:outer membrane protein assembly factor BamA [Treponema pedis]